MFVRKKKYKATGTCAVQIVENTREKNTTKQKVLRHVGTAKSEHDINNLIKIAEVFKEEIENLRLKSNKNIIKEYASTIEKHRTINTTKVSIKNLKEISRRILGIHDIYGYLYDKLGFTNLFSNSNKREEESKILKEIVLARIAEPASKKASVEILKEKFGINIPLHKVYRMMDKIDESFISRIQERALTETKKLIGNRIKVMFYDTTTLYFESFIDGDLKNKGYSKDMKFNQPQVLLSLFVTEQGLPIGYELFPGNTFEEHTLLPLLNKLKSKHNLEDIIFVADQGLFSEDNLNLLEKEGFKYIVGGKIKNKDRDLKDMILDKSNYNLYKKSDSEDMVANFNIKKERRLLVSYSVSRSKKDKKDREESIEKLYKKISKSKNPKSLVSNYGYKKYLKVSGDMKVELNEEKIKSSSKWDGLKGLVTNLKNYSSESILSYYKGLWQIEESFRINKHDLRIGLIFHWTSKKIKAHIALSFISFVCVRNLEYLVSNLGRKKLSPRVIKNNLLGVQCSIIKDIETTNLFLLPSPIPDEAKEIYRILKINIPNKTYQIKCGA